MPRNLLLILSMLSTSAVADWATVPDLTSSTLWQLVSENRAEVISSVGFGDTSDIHTKQTVFRIIKADRSEGDIKWAIDKEGKFRPVMCTEKWRDDLNYLGSSCSIPGCDPTSDKCLSKISSKLQ